MSLLKSARLRADTVTDKRLGRTGRQPFFSGGRGMGDTVLERKTVSIPRACEIVGVSRRTIYNWLAGGKIQYIRTAGGSVRIFEDSLWRDPSEQPSQQRAWPQAKPASERLTSRGA